MNDFTLDNVNEMYIDVLREIGNIGAGNATTSLASMINEQIDMNVPKVELMEASKLSSAICPEDEIIVGIFLEVTHDITGSMMFLMGDEERLAHGGIFTKCGYKKTPGKNHSHREFFICIVKRNTFGLERQIVLGITRSKFRSSGRSRRRNGSTRSHWSTCAYTLHFPCTDTVEPTVVPLAGVNVE